MKKGLHLLFMLFVVQGCRSPARPPVNSPDVVEWNEGKSLNWSDFKDKAPLFSNYDAQSDCSLLMAKKYNGDSAIIKVTANFYKSASWVRKGQKNDDLLNHEKRHFDLFEVVARIIRRDLYAFQGDKREKLEFYEIDESEFDYYKYLGSLNAEYDSVTNHGKNKVEQTIWNNKVDSLLNEYDDYKDIYVRIWLKNG